MCRKCKKHPGSEEPGCVVRYRVFPNVGPLVDSALGAEAVHIRFCIFTGHNEGSELLVGSVILPYLIAA